MAKVALITGITGQDGSYLAELLLSKGYIVHGLIRRASTFNTKRIEHLYQDRHQESAVNLYLHYGDLLDSGQLINLLNKVAPDEIYNLAAQSQVRVSFDLPEYTSDVVALGTLRLLEAIKNSGHQCRFYQASSSEMFGNTVAAQNEQTPFYPLSPYATAKLFSYCTARNYRESYGLFISNGILFNHESPRRGETFVSRKITMAIANIIAGKQKYLYLGNLSAYRDWGYAPEYVEAMWKMLQQDSAQDFVIGTGHTHTVKEFVSIAFDYVNLEWEQYVRFDPNYLRPLEVSFLQADSSKAKELLDWQPRIKFDELVKIMVDADLALLNLPSPGEGVKTLVDKNLAWYKFP